MLKFKALFAALIAVFSFSLGQVNGQVYDPVDWTFEVAEISASEVELVFKATIEEGWHVYSQELPSDEGPIATFFSFEESGDFSLVGKVKEGKFITEYDPNFEMDLNYFKDEAIFKQRVKRNSDKKFNVKGELTFMVCNEEMCLPPDYVDFDFKVKAGKVDTSTEVEIESAGIDVGQSQNEGILEPVTWEFAIEAENKTHATIVATATIDEPWHLYSVKEYGMGPIPTSMTLLDSSNVAFVGTLEEPEAHVAFDANFDIEVGSHEGTVTFRQRIEKLSDKKSTVSGFVSFMTCDDSKCIFPPDVYFDLDIEAGVKGVDAPQETIGEIESSEDKKSLWGIFGLAFLGGLAALLTPCVFPMIPMTVSFFTKQSKTKAEGIKKGLIYGISIIVIYVALSLPFHIFDSISPDVFNEFSTNPYLNIFFFLVFIVFAISFLGAFEITMPSSLVNKADQASDKGGLMGIFFMALTLILVSFSCTGPAIGLLLGSVLSSDGGATALSVGMAGFGVGIGLPFGLFAMFPGWLNSLPKSGGWLNVVKVSFGFLELAFAFKFLSNADLVTQYGMLHRELFIAIWVGVFLAWSLYMFGLYKLPHDSPTTHLSVGRSILATFLLVFVIYLLPGMWGAPLKLISGFPPPMFYSESPDGVGKSAAFIPTASTEDGANEEVPEGADPAHCPHGLNCFHDYNEGVAYAKSVGKPIMLDFTGWACVNCRRMEENVWSDPRVLDQLRGDVVLISLYVDEREKLPESEQYVSEVTGKKIRTVGNRWSEFQIKNYKSNTQPYYILLNHDEEMLVEAANYQNHGSVDLFSDWLQRGIEEYKK